MANFGLYEKPYVKIGTSSDVCYCCQKDICDVERRDAYDVAHELRGRLENQFVFFIRRSGQDTCICFDCLKNIANELTANDKDIKEEVNEIATTVTEEVTAETTTEEVKETKKASNKKTNK